MILFLLTHSDMIMILTYGIFIWYFQNMVIFKYGIFYMVFYEDEVNFEENAV